MPSWRMMSAATARVAVAVSASTGALPSKVFKPWSLR